MTHTFDKEFFDKLASPAPVPGGGGVACVCAALSTALSQMVINLTLGKKKYADQESQMRTEAAFFKDCQQRFLAGIDEDAEAFSTLSWAYSLPKETPEEQELRKKAIQEGLVCAAQPPLKLMRLVAQSIEHIDYVAHKGSVLVRSDAGIAALCAQTAFEAAAFNVWVNARLIDDERVRVELLDEVKTLMPFVDKARSIAVSVQEEILHG